MINLEIAIDNYKQDYNGELKSCDRWISWCKERNDTHGMNFYEGMRAALVYNNIRVEILFRQIIIKVEKVAISADSEPIVTRKGAILPTIENTVNK
jgi:hypothetical protein